ncbi:MAG: DUF4363 family protein [Ruminococcaceae bacterium]|nr:DUF4363 family protein [Oscillospiraceae bacterium]
MKRLYVAFTLIALSLTLCLLSNSKVEKSATEMQKQLTVIGDEIKKEQSSNVKQLLDEAEKSWERTEKLYSFIVDADKIEEMNIGFMMIKRHLEDGNKEHALERLHECELMLSEISENEKLNVKNIL